MMHIAKHYYENETTWTGFVIVSDVMLMVVENWRRRRWVSMFLRRVRRGGTEESPPITLTMAPFKALPIIILLPSHPLPTVAPTTTTLIIAKDKDTTTLFQFQFQVQAYMFSLTWVFSSYFQFGADIIYGSAIDPGVIFLIFIHVILLEDIQELMSLPNNYTIISLHLDPLVFLRMLLTRERNVQK